MNETEAWVNRWLAVSKADLGAGTLEEWTTLPFYPLFNQPLPLEREPVAVEYLHQLHTHLHGNALYEGGAWEKLIWQTPTPIPLEIVDDFIERDIAISALGHTQHQNEEALRRLAPHSGEALLHWTTQIYSDPARSASEFAKVLDQHPMHQWIYHQLAHQVASSPEKEAVFLKRVEGRPEWQVAQKMKAVHERRESERQERKRRLQSARTTTDVAQMHELYRTAVTNCSQFNHITINSEVLLGLIQNPAIPLDLLILLGQVRGFGGARSLRAAAKSALAQRDK